jgi:hypothetical protein
MAQGDRAVLDRSGRFGIREDDEFRIYSPSGSLLGDVTGIQPYQYFKLVPTAQRVFAPVVEQTGLHSMQVDETEVLDLQGDVIDSFNTSGLRTSPFGIDHLLLRRRRAAGSRTEWHQALLQTGPELLARLRAVVPTAAGQKRKQEESRTKLQTLHDDIIGENALRLDCKRIVRS